jgi:ketoreductase
MPDHKWVAMAASGETHRGKIVTARRSALITGASGEIGSAIAVRFAELDYSLVLVGRHRPTLELTAGQIAGQAPDAKTRIGICDVADSEAVSALFDGLALAAANLHVLVNGAGVVGGGGIADVHPKLWRDVIDTNLSGTFFVTREALSRKLIPPGGRIINIAAASELASTLGAPYAASNYGVIGLTRALGLELAETRSGITVNAVCPGLVDTAMATTLRETYAKLWDVSAEEAKARLEARVPIGRYVTPFEVADIVAYLASPRAAALTAQAFSVSGGLGS